MHVCVRVCIHTHIDCERVCNIYMSPKGAEKESRLARDYRTQMNDFLLASYSPDLEGPTTWRLQQMQTKNSLKKGLLLKQMTRKGVASQD